MIFSTSWIAGIAIVFLHAISAQTSYGRYDYGVDVNTLVRRQSSASDGPVVVTGDSAINGSGNGNNGSFPVRKEVRELQGDNLSWTLYILGLDMMQGLDQADDLSWYQIMGIHGRPFLPWDDVQAQSGDADNGYCTHVSILFPTWHRPYLALFEHGLYNLIQGIAVQYPAGSTRDQYVAAATNFRIPYWDWAMANQPGGSVLPDSVGGSPSVTVDGPYGTQTIGNPLFSYRFDPLSSSDFPDSPFNVYPTTLRRPTTGDASAESQNDLVASQLDGSASTFRSRLYNLFTNYDNYTTFSNEAYTDAQADSIESLHDTIHGMSGGGAHMTYVEYSSFDPIFMLHHAMVDRCFALWQVLHPDSYVEAEAASFSTFTTSAGATQDVNSALTPFRHSSDSSDFWTSAEVVTTQTFGYVYPETSGSSPSQIQADVINAINTLYSPPATNPARKSKSKSKSKTRTRFTRSHHQPRDLLSENQYYEWITNIAVQKQALNQPFFIHIFLGAFSDSDPNTYATSPSLVGTHCIFARAPPNTPSSSSSSSTSRGDQLVSGTIPLTDKLQEHVDAGELASLDPDDVQAYLRDKLRYRVTLADGSRVENGEVEGLRVGVVSSVVEKAGASQNGIANGIGEVVDGVLKGLPRWGDLVDRGGVCGD